MNELILHKDGSRTISGELAHILAKDKPNLHGEVPTNRFAVYEYLNGEWILRASQSSVRKAYSYISPDRVMVYYHEQ